MSLKACISPEKFDIKDLVFGELTNGEFQDGKSFEKIPISVRRSDGSIGPLIIVTEPCFSFGVQKDSKYDTYTLPLALCDRDESTPGQKLFVKVIRDILSAGDPKPKSCLYGDEGNPILYLRLEYDKRYGEFTTRFYERDTQPRSQALSYDTPRGGETLVAAGHVTCQLSIALGGEGGSCFIIPAFRHVRIHCFSVLFGICGSK